MTETVAEPVSLLTVLLKVRRIVRGCEGGRLVDPLAIFIGCFFL